MRRGMRSTHGTRVNGVFPIGYEKRGFEPGACRRFRLIRNDIAFVTGLFRLEAKRACPLIPRDIRFFCQFAREYFFPRRRRRLKLCNGRNYFRIEPALNRLRSNNEPIELRLNSLLKMRLNAPLVSNLISTINELAPLSLCARVLFNL